MYGAGGSRTSATSYDAHTRTGHQQNQHENLKGRLVRHQNQLLEPQTSPVSRMELSIVIFAEEPTKLRL